MSERIRHPSAAVSLSAQNLASSPQSFVCAPVGHFPSQFVPNFPTVQQQYANTRIPYQSNAAFDRQTQKMREYEQQRSKLQQWKVKGTSAKDPDAMIAQMVGKALVGAGNVNHAAATGNTIYNGQMNSSSSYVRAAAANGADARKLSASNRPAMPRCGGPERPPSSGSAVHLMPRDLEKMIHHVAAMQLGNEQFQAATATDRSYGDLSSNNLQQMAPVGGIFVIPTLPVPSPDGQFQFPSANCSQHSMPQWTREKAKLPEEYAKYYHLCLAPNRPQGLDMPDTGLVYVLLRTSGLSNEILGTIWALTNRSHPGQLTKEEFFASLALVALAQETGSIASWDVLCNLSRPPVPRLSHSALIVPVTTASYSTASPSPDPVDNRSFTKPPPAGHSDLAVTNSSQAPAGPCLPVSAAASSNDDFGEFTDFHAAQALPPASLSTGDIAMSTNSLDKYDALRALTGPDDATVEEARGENRLRSASLVATKSIDSADWPSENVQRGQICNFAVDQPIIDGFASKKDSRNGFKFPAAASGAGLGAVTSKPTGHTEPKMTSPFNTDIANVQHKDFNELLRQACASLDFGGNNVGNCSVNSEEDTCSIRSGSKEPSVHSLDLHSIKQFDIDKEGADADCHNGQVPEIRGAWSPAGSVSLVDRYAAFRETDNQNGQSPADKHVDAWTKCLGACLQLLKQAEKIFSNAEEGNTRKEILATDRGSKYWCGNVQIYRVSRRIRLSLQTTAFQTDKLIDLLTDIETTWTNLAALVAFSGMLPPPDKLDFRSAVIQPSKQVNEQEQRTSCGVCLLNVDASCKTDNGTSFDYKLTYAGRQYHAQCANLWINCIDSILPALDIPSLL